VVGTFYGDYLHNQYPRISLFDIFNDPGIAYREDIDSISVNIWITRLAYSPRYVKQTHELYRSFQYSHKSIIYYESIRISEQST
jgi:hypothetical protein